MAQMPTARLRRLARTLRGLRNEHGLTREEVAARTSVNEATLYRLETAKARPQRRTLLTLLDTYGVDGDKREAILTLSTQLAEQGWLRPHHADLRDEYVGYISFENEARSVRNYESLFIPGLLQTEGYARAAIRGVLPTAATTKVDQLVQARIERQTAFAKETPLELWAIVDEASLRRLVGGPKVMIEQLNHLIGVSAQPNVTLQVIPWAAGAHPGMPGSFVLMDFPDPEDPELVYIDSMAGDLFLEADEDIRRYNQIFDHLRALALSPENSASLVTALVREMT